MILLSATTEGTEFVARLTTLRLIASTCQIAHSPSRTVSKRTTRKPAPIRRGVAEVLVFMGKIVATRGIEGETRWAHDTPVPRHAGQRTLRILPTCYGAYLAKSGGAILRGSGG